MNEKEAREIVTYILNLGDMGAAERVVLANALDPCTRNFAKGYLEGLETGRREATLEAIDKWEKKK